MPVAYGTRLGHYEVTTPLGAGGMGEVYRARDTKLGRDVALKVLPDAFARDAQRMARFQREAKVLASLNHPNIATIYGVEDCGSPPALVMELVEGPTLADRIRQGPIPIEEALRLAKQICDALEYAHERGIVHRDLKPANVKVAHDDTVKILDFGLAKAMEDDPASLDISTSPTLSRMATQAGVLLGTAAYMSPEQAKGKPVDRRADIWAFGCVLYEMLTGKHMFSGETTTDTLASVIKEEPDWSPLPTATPERVRVLLQRCLQKDPRQRLRDIGDARISIEEVLAGAPELFSGAVTPVAGRLWRRVLPWALFGAAVAALLVLGFFHFRSKPTAINAVRLQMPFPDKTIQGAAGSFALSPDGRQFAFFAAGTDGVQRLWLRPLDAIEAHPLASESTFSDPPPFFWSWDSRSIAFDGGGNLKKIGIFGGQAQKLCDLSGSFLVGGSWNRDGVILFGQDPGVIERVPADGGSASPLTALDSSRGEIAHTFPTFLPDGRHFLYLRTSNQQENDGIYVGSLDAKPENQDPKRLLETAHQAIYVPSLDSESGHLLFMREGTLIAQPFDIKRLELTGEPVTIAEQVGSYREFGFFSPSTNGVLAYRIGSIGTSRLTWFDQEGKVLGTVGEQAIYGILALSPDGTQAAVERRDPQSGKYAIWLFDFSRGTSARFTFGSAGAQHPIWSQDGKRIIFASNNPNGVLDLYQKEANGAKAEEPLVQSSESKSPGSVSPDGRFLMYVSNSLKSKLDLWVLPLQGDAKPSTFLQTDANEGDGHFSPDGHFVAYRSDESGRWEIYVRPFSQDSGATQSTTGGKWQISNGGGIRPSWSPDGKELYYLTPDGKVMIVPVSTRPTFQAGAPKFLFQVQPGRIVGGYTADGKRFLFPVPVVQSAQTPFSVVLNWQAALKK
jgi:eukaryotic-like serine/threonine-protein kinase